MPVFSKNTDRILTFVVRFVCGVIIGWLVYALIGYRGILEIFANGPMSKLLIRLALWGGIGGLIFALTKAKDDHQWLE